MIINQKHMRYLGYLLKMHTSENRTTEIRRSQGPSVILTNHHTHNLILLEFPALDFLDILPLLLLLCFESKLQESKTDHNNVGH